MKTLSIEDYAKSIVCGKDQRVLITPRLAEEFLKRNDNNRKISYAYVNSYAKMMKEGKWDKTGEPISFNTEGKLEDGQHRLKAIIMSGKSVEMLVSTQNKVNGTYDENRRRTAVNFANRYFKEDDSRYSNGKTISTINSVLRATGRVGGRRIASVEITEFIENNRSIVDRWLNTVPTTSNNGTPTPVRGAMFLALADGVDEKTMRKFYDILYTGFMNEEKDKSVIAFRNWLLNQKANTGFAMTDIIYKRTQYALKKYIEGKATEKSYEPKELIWAGENLK